MELVIKIPKELYESYKGRPPMLGDAGMDIIAQSIANGTPLPKGHGDLIDRKELTKYPPIWMEDKRRTGEDDAAILLSDILKAEPIIEADKESEQE